MRWFEQLQQASFRDVPFHVDKLSHQAGDTVVVREYPFQDLPTVFRTRPQPEPSAAALLPPISFAGTPSP